MKEIDNKDCSLQEILVRIEEKLERQNKLLEGILEEVHHL